MNAADRSNTQHDMGTLWMMTVWIVYIAVLMEWLFFVTKQSFLSAVGTSEKLLALLTAPVPVVVLCTVVLLPFLVVATVTKRREVLTACRTAGLAAPAIVLAATALLMIDNFTYTVFGFGFSTSSGILRYQYIVLFLALIVVTYRYMGRFHTLLARSAARRIRTVVTLSLLAVSIITAVFVADTAQLADLKRRLTSLPLAEKPNIIVLSIDGLDAKNLSVYGYERDTTPFLREFAGDALVCENNFPNADASAASIASIFTGKLPTETHLVFPPDILDGDDAHQHLPGLLKEYGYTTIDFGVRYYVDPLDINMIDAFDWISNKRISKPTAAILLGSLFGDRAYFLLRRISERLTDRLLHAFGLRVMEDPLAGVAATSTQELKDTERVESILSALDDSPPPVFIHAHFLGAHGPKFDLTNQVFSAGQQETDLWMTDFYDDAILQLDEKMKRIVDGLEQRDILEQTILVFCTDHGKNWNGHARAPLIFRFPRGAHRGRIRENTQNLDIAATLLDYLGIDQPGWMGGLSIISSGGESRRHIFTVERVPGLTIEPRNRRRRDMRRAGPPFYGIKSAVIVYCHKVFELNLQRSRLLVSTIEDHTSPCEEGEIPDAELLGRSLIAHLRENGYDVSSIKTPLFTREVGNR